MTTIRKTLSLLSSAATDTAATHGLLIWLDTLPLEILIAASGKRQAGIAGDVTNSIPGVSLSPTIERLIDSDACLARTYWEHPNMIYSGSDFSDG
jgi:hypothetical protein